MAARKNKIKHDEKTKDAIRASQLVNFLTRSALAKKKGKPLDPSRIAAAKAVLPFLKPQLSSVEQTILDPRDTADAGDLEAKLAAMFTENPDLLARVLNLQRKASTPLDVVGDPADSLRSVN